MDRQQLILAIAATLLGAFLAGWFAGWLVRRVLGSSGTREGDRAAGEAARARLLEAERARDAAMAELTACRGDLDHARATLATAQIEIEELRNYIDRKLGRRGGPVDQDDNPRDQREEDVHDGEGDRREGAGRRTA